MADGDHICYVCETGLDDDEYEVCHSCGQTVCWSECARCHKDTDVDDHQYCVVCYIDKGHHSLWRVVYQNHFSDTCYTLLETEECNAIVVWNMLPKLCFDYTKRLRLKKITGIQNIFNELHGG